MKTKMLTTIALFLFSFTYAQIPNSSFELINTCGLTANWSYIPLTMIIVDSIGNEHVDSIVYDGVNYFNYPVNDAHSGNYAISIRNAYSYTYNEVYVGKASVFSDSADCSAFFLSMLPINYDPTEFSFFYKYLPLNNDTAYAKATLYDTMGYEIASAEKFFIGTQSTYNQVTIPFNYTTTDPVAFFSIDFYNRIPDGYSNYSTLGTRFLIDDVSFSGNNGISDHSDQLELLIYPNPASHSFTFKYPANILLNKVTLLDMYGRTIKMYQVNDVFFDCSMLTPGIYTVCAETNKGMVTRKLLVSK